MANQKLTDRTEILSANDDDFIHVVQGGVSYKIKKSNLLSSLGDMLKSVYDTNDNGIVDNAEALNGIASSQFLRKDVSDIKTNGNLRFNTNVRIELGTSGAGAEIFYNGSNNYFKIKDGDLIIQDNSTTRATFNRATGILDLAGIQLDGKDDTYVVLAGGGSKKLFDVVDSVTNIDFSLARELEVNDTTNNSTLTYTFTNSTVGHSAVVTIPSGLVSHFLVF